MHMFADVIGGRADGPLPKINGYMGTNCAT